MVLLALAIALAGVAVGDSLAFGGLSLWSLVLVIAYLFVLQEVRLYEGYERRQARETAEEQHQPAHRELLDRLDRPYCEAALAAASSPGAYLAALVRRTSARVRARIAKFADAATMQ
jgi:hypothetical protein